MHSHEHDAPPTKGLNPKFTLVNANIATADGQHSLVIPKLAKSTKYYRANSIQEEGIEGFSKLKEFDFKTSAAAVFRLDKYDASYVDLSWSTDEVWRKMALLISKSGKTNFETKSWTTAMNWTPDSTKNFTVTGLKPSGRKIIDLSTLGVDRKSEITRR